MLDVSAALTAGRMYAAELMTDIFTAYSHNGTTTDGNGFQVPAYASQGTTLGKLRGAGGRDTNTRYVTVGGTERPVVDGGLALPLDAPVPAVGEYGIGWEYVLTELGPDTDASLLGSRWLVVDAPAKSYATARRLDVVRLA